MEKGLVPSTGLLWDLSRLIEWLGTFCQTQVDGLYATAGWSREEARRGASGSSWTSVQKGSQTLGITGKRAGTRKGNLSSRMVEPVDQPNL